MNHLGCSQKQKQNIGSKHPGLPKHGCWASPSPQTWEPWDQCGAWCNVRVALANVDTCVYEPLGPLGHGVTLTECGSCEGLLLFDVQLLLLLHIHTHTPPHPHSPLVPRQQPFCTMACPPWPQLVGLKAHQSQSLPLDSGTGIGTAAPSARWVARSWHEGWP